MDMTEAQASSTKRIAEALADDDPDLQEKKRLALSGSPADLTSLLNTLIVSQQQQAQQFMDFQKQQTEAMTLLVNRIAGSVTSDPIAPSTPAPTVGPATPVPQTQALLQTVPKALDKAILEKTKSFKDAVFRLARARNHLGKLKTDCDTFSAQGLKYPPKYRPFKSPVSFAELDQPLDVALLNDTPFQVVIPVGMSCRDAMALIHHRAAGFVAATFLEAQEKHVSTTSSEADPSILKDLVEQVVAEAAKPDLAESFGLPKPLTATICPDAVKHRVEALYSSIYEKLNAKLHADQQAAAKSRDSLQAANAEVINSSPSDLLDKLVESKLSQRLHDAGLGVALMTDAAPASLAKEFVHSMTHQPIDPPLPKNDSSPPPRVGHKYVCPQPKSDPSTKGKTTGKGKGKMKGKGKGKGKGNSKGKGSTGSDNDAGKGGQARGPRRR